MVFLHLKDDNQEEEDDYLAILGAFCFLLTNHLSGIIIIFIADYFPQRPTKYNGLGVFALTLLNMLTGGYGSFITIFKDNNCFCKNKCGNCIATFFKIIWCIIGMLSQLSFTILIFSPQGLMIFIFYESMHIVYIIISFIFHFVGRNKENENEVEDMPIFNYDSNRINNISNERNRNRNNNTIYRRNYSNNIISSNDSNNSGNRYNRREIQVQQEIFINNYF